MTQKILHFIEEHDESWVFFFVYLVMSILLSIFFNLGFFLMLMLVHLALDFIKHWKSANRHTNRFWRALEYALRDGFLLDFVLLLLAFSFGFILEFAFAIGLSRGVKVASSIRVQNLLRAVPRVVVGNWIVENVTQLTIYLNEHDKKKVYMPVRMTRFEKFLVASMVVVTVLIFFLPIITGDNYQVLGEYFVREFSPLEWWRFGE